MTESEALASAGSQYPAVTWSSASAAYIVADGKSGWVCTGSLPDVQEPVIIIVD